MKLIFIKLGILLSLILTISTSFSANTPTKSVIAYADGTLAWPLALSLDTITVEGINILNPIASTNISINTLSFQGPTNNITLQHSIINLYYTAISDMSITGYTGLTAGELSIVIFTVTNSAATNITVRIPIQTKTPDGLRAYIITNATEGVFNFKIQSESTNCVFKGVFY